MSKAINFLHKSFRPAPVTEDMIVRYLNGELGRVTLGTFIAKTLRGKAKDYAKHYHNAMDQRIWALVKAGLVLPVPSVRGGISYRWIN